MKPLDIAESKWNAGRVDRWHAHPTIHNQTVADHTYGVLQMLRLVVPEGALTEHLIFAALDHDIAEAFTGDTPYTAKRMYPSLKAALDQAEFDIHKRLNANYLLTEKEERYLKFADLADMGFYAIRERALGNSFMDGVMDNIISHLWQLMVDGNPYNPGMEAIINHFTQERNSWQQMISK